MSSLVQRMKARSQKTSLAETQQETAKFQQMSLIEMRQQIIDFGEKYRGKSYEQAFQDAVWAEWFVSTYAKSNKTAHQRFLIFVEKQLDAETMNPDARIEPGPSATSLNKTKAKEVSAKATPKMPVETSLQDWDALSEEESSQQPCARSAGTDVEHASQSPQHAPTHVRNRDSPPRVDWPLQGHPGEERELSVLRDHEATNLHAQDWAQQQLNDLPPNVDIDFEFTTTAHPKSFSKEFQHWVTVFEKEINTVRRLNFDAVKTRRLDLLEVMCSPESELTKQVNSAPWPSTAFWVV